MRDDQKLLAINGIIYQNAEFQHIHLEAFELCCTQTQTRTDQRLSVDYKEVVRVE